MTAERRWAEACTVSVDLRLFLDFSLISCRRGTDLELGRSIQEYWGCSGGKQRLQLLHNYQHPGPTTSHRKHSRKRRGHIGIDWGKPKFQGCRTISQHVVAIWLWQDRLHLPYLTNPIENKIRLQNHTTRTRPSLNTTMSSKSVPVQRPPSDHVHRLERPWTACLLQEAYLHI